MKKVFKFNDFIIIIATYLLTINQFCLSQNYDFEKYLSDSKLEHKMYSLRKSEKYDSIKYYLSNYENRLGYQYYLNKAVVEKIEGSSEAMKYLDSSFRRGLGIKCMGNDMKLFEYDAVMNSFELNYLKDYDEAYRIDLQLMDEQDQKYRPDIGVYNMELRSELKTSNGRYNRDTSGYTKEQKDLKKVIDSLILLQSKFDTLNFKMFRQLILEKGWPSAKLVGMTECFTSKIVVPGILIMHNGTTETYVIDYLKRVIPLCMKNEDSWRNTETLMFYLYNRSRLRSEFADFWFLEVKNKKINYLKSYFAIYKMTEIVIKNPTEKLELKCKDVDLYNEIKKYMLIASSQIQVSPNKNYSEIGKTTPENFLDSRLVFIQDKKLSKDKVYFRFSVQ